jgi:hypothetical protein
MASYVTFLKNSIFVIFTVLLVINAAIFTVGRMTAQESKAQKDLAAKLKSAEDNSAMWRQRYDQAAGSNFVDNMKRPASATRAASVESAAQAWERLYHQAVAVEQTTTDENHELFAKLMAAESELSTAEVYRKRAEETRDEAEAQHLRSIIELGLQAVQSNNESYQRGYSAGQQVLREDFYRKPWLARADYRFAERLFHDGSHRLGEICWKIYKHLRPTITGLQW